MRTLIEIMKTCCDEGDGIVLSRSYSGRGMYNTCCVAISGNEQGLNETLGMVYAAIVNDIHRAAMDGESVTAAVEEAYRYIELLTGRCCDNLGRGVVYYWPRWQEEQGESPW